jgi:hypothetical protein
MANGPAGYIWDPQKRSWVPKPSTERPVGPESVTVPSSVVDDSRGNDPRRGTTLPGPAQKPAFNRLKILQNAGYKVTGKGKLMERAWNNFVAAQRRKLDVNKAGAYWSSQQGKGGQTQPGAATTAPGSTTPGTTGDTTTGLSGDATAFQNRFLEMLEQSMGNLIDPKAYANAATNAEYDGSLSELARQIKQAPIRTGQNEHDISSWYGQAEGTRAAGAAQNAQVGQSLLTGMDEANKGTIGAFEGSQAAGMMGAWGSLLQGGLKSDVATQERFDNSMKGLLSAESAGALQNERNYGTRELAELQAERAGLIREKGTAGARNLIDAQDRRMQQLAGIQNMMLGSQTSGLDYALKEGQLKGQQQQGKLTQQQIKNAQLANDLDQAKLDYAESVMANTPEGWNTLKQEPATLQKLAASLAGSVTSKNKKGMPHAQPKTLYNKFAGMLQSYNLDPNDPFGRTFLTGVLRQLFPNQQQYPFQFLNK